MYGLPELAGIFDPDGDDITATKLAIDCQVDHG
jgi:hypothetical protein